MKLLGYREQSNSYLRRGNCSKFQLCRKWNFSKLMTRWCCHRIPASSPMQMEYSWDTNIYQLLCLWVRENGIGHYLIIVSYSDPMWDGSEIDNIVKLEYIWPDPSFTYGYPNSGFFFCVCVERSRIKWEIKRSNMLKRKQVYYFIFLIHWGEAQLKKNIIINLFLLIEYLVF